MSAACCSKGRQPRLLNHPLAQHTLFNGYLPSRSSLFWDIHLKAPAFVYEYLSGLDGPVVVKGRCWAGSCSSWKIFVFLRKTWAGQPGARFPSLVLLLNQTWEHLHWGERLSIPTQLGR